MTQSKKADQPNLFGEIDENFNTAELELTLVREEIDSTEKKIESLQKKLDAEGGLYHRRDRLSKLVKSLGAQRDKLRPAAKKGGPGKAS